MNGGHYTCYAKNIYSKKWYEFNDNNVKFFFISFKKNYYF